ncbi:MAG: L-histidine N(alpha)-methyltransferase [Bryobacteraceae bacterium]
MKIDVVLTEREIEEELSEGLEARDLSEKCFYWSPFSVRAYQSLTAEPWFDSIRRCWKQLAQGTARLLQPFDDTIPVISLGAGDGVTDSLLLEPVRDSGREQKYFPVDASQSLLEMACAGAEDLDIETAGIKADISSPMHLVFASDAAESPKLMLMSGNTLGGFDPLEHIRAVAQCLHPGDRLVLDAQIGQGDGNAIFESDAMRYFSFAPLAALCVSPEDGEIRFEQKHDERMPGLSVTRAFFRVNRDLRVAVPGREILMQRGENITLNLRYAFTPDTLHSLLEDHADLDVLEKIPSPDGGCLLAVCSR